MHFENFGSRRRRYVSCYCSCCCWLLLGRVCLAGGESKVSEWREINSLRLLRKQPGGWECSRCNQRSTPQRYIYLFYLILWLWRRLWPMSHGLSSVCRAEFVRSSSMHSPRRPFDIENSCVKRSFVLRFFISFSFARRETESSSSSSFCPFAHAVLERRWWKSTLFLRQLQRKGYFVLFLCWQRKLNIIYIYSRNKRTKPTKLIRYCSYFT